jgi:hypothetical protein
MSIEHSELFKSFQRRKRESRELNFFQAFMLLVAIYILAHLIIYII